jgi:hypothetical protein
MGVTLKRVVASEPRAEFVAGQDERWVWEERLEVNDNFMPGPRRLQDGSSGQAPHRMGEVVEERTIEKNVSVDGTSYSIPLTFTRTIASKPRLQVYPAEGGASFLTWSERIHVSGRLSLGQHTMRKD